MSAAPLGADTGGPGAAVPGRWLGVGTRSGEDRRKVQVPRRFGHQKDWFTRSGKERRVALTAPDDRCPRCGAAGPLELVGPGFHFTHACDPYKRAENAQRWAASDDDDTADFVASILQAEIDRDLLARAQHPSYRRDEHEHAGLGVPPV